jgi:hypothetical protein
MTTAEECHRVTESMSSPKVCPGQAATPTKIEKMRVRRRSLWWRLCLHGGALLCQRVELVWRELTVTPEGSAVTSVLIHGIGWPLSDGKTGWPRASERLGVGRRGRAYADGALFQLFANSSETASCLYDPLEVSAAWSRGLGRTEKPGNAKSGFSRPICLVNGWVRQCQKMLAIGRVE